VKRELVSAALEQASTPTAGTFRVLGNHAGRRSRSRCSPAARRVGVGYAAEAVSVRLSNLMRSMRGVRQLGRRSACIRALEAVFAGQVDVGGATQRFPCPGSAVLEPSTATSSDGGRLCRWLTTI